MLDVRGVSVWKRTPALFLSHGAALFTSAAGDANHQFLRRLGLELPDWNLRGIVVVSAHDSAYPIRITGAGPLRTIHDHPVPFLRDFRYPARGSEELSAKMTHLLSQSGIESRIDATRGLDHGAWIPLSLAYPSAQVPIAQVSLDARAAVERHLALGEALSALRDLGVLLIGSGGVTHDQAAFRRGLMGSQPVDAPEPFAHEFDRWVTSVVESGGERGRAARLADFAAHPLAAKCHPTIEHFLPLIVIAAASEGEPARKLFEGFQYSLSTSAFRFGRPY